MHFCLWYLFPLGLNMAREYIYIYFLYPTGEFYIWQYGDASLTYPDISIF